MRKKYFFQDKKRKFAQKFFEKGLTAESYILFSVKEGGKLFLQGLPSVYPSIKLMQEIFGATPEESNFNNRTVRTNLRRLEEQGLIVKEPKKKIYCLTDKGEEFLFYIKDRYSVLKKPWDRKIRMVIFDIPEEKKRWRYWLRKELLLLQFRQFQKSVYVGKCPLPKSLYEEIEEGGLKDYILVFTAEKIDQENKITEMLEE